jgi:hypothetical protein
VHIQHASSAVLVLSGWLICLRMGRSHTIGRSLLIGSQHARIVRGAHAQFYCAHARAMRSGSARSPTYTHKYMFVTVCVGATPPLYLEACSQALAMYACCLKHVCTLEVERLKQGRGSNIMALFCHKCTFNVISNDTRDTHSLSWKFLRSGAGRTCADPD